jgi:hypothetical protein
MNLYRVCEDEFMTAVLSETAFRADPATQGTPTDLDRFEFLLSMMVELKALTEQANLTPETVLLGAAIKEMRERLS